MKNILLIATGGTIASVEDGGGLRPALAGEELARYVPEVAGLCELDVVQPMNIDSTNMRPADWMRIRDEIVRAYDAYDGFVVLHGTDTMAYTAAALSYLIQESPKPIVLTGSQKPMASPFTDAKLNVYQSLLYAADDRSREVSVVFGGAVIAGTRARKQRTMSFNAFSSVNFPEVALIRNDRIVRAGAPMATRAQGEGGASAPLVYDRLDERVCVLKLMPGMNPELFSLLARDYDALILETFGVGGVPAYGADHAGARGGVRSGRLRGRARLRRAPRHPRRRRHDHRGARGEDHVGARAGKRRRRGARAVRPCGEPRPHDGVRPFPADAIRRGARSEAARTRLRRGEACS